MSVRAIYALLSKCFAWVLAFGLGSAATCEAAVPVIVKITGHGSSETDGPGPVKTRALGYIVEAEGFVLTNYSNLVDATTGRLMEHYRVTQASSPERTFRAGIVGVEPTINVGILKIDGAEGLHASVDARSLPLFPGMRVRAAAGGPDEKLTISDGEITALNTRLCYQESLTSTMLRARISLGADAVGGPIFLADTGEVIALYTGSKPAPQPGHVEDPEERHLLPISLCFNIYEALKQKRSLRSPWTGFSVRSLNGDELRFFPTNRTHTGGVGIEYVWPGSPAESLGVRANDVLVQFGYNRIHSVADFQKWLYMNGVGQTVKLVFLRNGRDYLAGDCTIQERPPSVRPR